MTPERQRIKIAEALGWSVGGPEWQNAWINPSGKPCEVPPNYPSDLNAMHAAAMELRITKPLNYVYYAAEITRLVANHNSDLENNYCISAHDATATQRAEAFLRALNLWEKS